MSETFLRKVKMTHREDNEVKFRKSNQVCVCVCVMNLLLWNSNSIVIRAEGLQAVSPNEEMATTSLKFNFYGRQPNISHLNCVDAKLAACEDALLFKERMFMCHLCMP